MTSSSIDARGTVPVSVVVVSFNGLRLLASCLEALDAQWDPERAELLIVGHWASGGPDVSHLRQQYAHARWLSAPPTHNVAQMRTLGMRDSRGEVVVFLEDDCVPSPSWLARLPSAFTEPQCAAVGGAVEPGAYTHARDWAAYLCEYGRFMRPLPETAVALPGTNVSYRREIVRRLLDDLGAGDDGFYETFVNRAVERAGYRLCTDSELVVRNVKTWSLPRLLATRYHHGRGYAGLRVAEFPVWRRVPYIGFAALLSPVLVARVGREVLIRRRHMWVAARALGWIVGCALAWSAGEFVGYLRGPGRSLERWQ